MDILIRFLVLPLWFLSDVMWETGSWFLAISRYIWNCGAWAEIAGIRLKNAIWVRVYGTRLVRADVYEFYVKIDKLKQEHKNE